jgi:hypothetical protein
MANDALPNSLRLFELALEEIIQLSIQGDEGNAESDRVVLQRGPSGRDAAGIGDESNLVDLRSSDEDRIEGIADATSSRASDRGDRAKCG